MATLPCTLADWAALGIEGQVHYGERAKALPYQRVIERKTAQALALIQRFHGATAGRGYVSVSFGKDSLVAWHLAQQVVPTIPAVWINQGPLAEWPDCLALKEILTMRYGMVLHELMPDCTLYDWYKQFGLPVSAAMDSTDDKALNEALIYAPLRRFQQEGDWHGTIWGLRGVREAHREGLHREVLLNTRGLLYQRKDCQWRCSPVGRWTTQHIWAYIDFHALPYPAMYDIDRASIRNGPPLGTSARHFGRVENLHRYFPVIYRHILQEFPAFTAHDLL
jgi:3'-phosphoadenosine 5'-phosphosulfate sulfotransferase (PAPS reductase)/FAD synthetase